MKKINVLLMAAIAIILFSCGNENVTKNENTKDSTSITQKTAIETTNNFESMSSVELKNKLISNEKKYVNEYYDKTIILTDLLVYSYESKYEENTLITYAFDAKENIVFTNSSYKGVFNLNGVKIDNAKDEKDYFKRGDNYITIELKNKDQLNYLKMLDKSRDFGNIEQEGNNFVDLIKVKGIIQIDGNMITLKDSEIIK